MISKKGIANLTSKGKIISLVGVIVFILSVVLAYLICILEIFGPVPDPPMCVYAVLVYGGVAAAVIFVIGIVVFIAGLLKK